MSHKESTKHNCQKTEITLTEFQSMPDIERMTFIEENYPASKVSMAGRGKVCGIGVNDANYIVAPRIEDKQVMHPAYRAWASILWRCYDQKFLSRAPTYAKATVCEQWHTFSTFRLWWIDNHVDEWHLDKDLLSEGKVYSPETSIFVPQWLNKFTLGRDASRGDCPIGVHYCKRDRAFQSYCSHPFRSGRDSLGYFPDQNSAHAAWLRRKLDIALELKPLMDEIDVRIYCGVTKIIKSMR